MSFTSQWPRTTSLPTAWSLPRIVTSCGEIVLELNNSGAPETANSFVFLAREGFYDGQVIHRISENFVFQTGDPVANGTGGPGYVIADEFPEDGLRLRRGRGRDGQSRLAAALARNSSWWWARTGAS